MDLPLLDSHWKWLYGDNGLFILDEKNISHLTEAILNVFFYFSIIWKSLM